MVVPQMAEVDAAIAEHCYDRAAILLETLSANGMLTAEEEVSLALVLMWPPLAAWDDCLKHLRKLLATNAAFEATIWGAYICHELYPNTDEFHVALNRFPDHAEACYLLSQQANGEGNYALACSWIQKAISIDPFPNALRLASKLCPDRLKSEELLIQAMNGVVDRRFESSGQPQSLRELKRENWRELIRGELLTSFVWDAYFGKLYKREITEGGPQGRKGSGGGRAHLTKIPEQRGPEQRGLNNGGLNNGDRSI